MRTITHHPFADLALTLALQTAGTLFLCASAAAQTTLNNPLIRPQTATREPALPAPPPGAPANAVSNRSDGPVQAKSLQEEVTANAQRLNADRIPAPLRILLATVYVSAIHGHTAVLRQPLPPTQQALLAAQAQGIAAGVPGAIPGAVPGAIPSAVPGAIPGALPSALPGAVPGVAPGAGLASGAGLVNPFAVPPPRPTSIRVRDGEPFSLQGFELVARIREQEVTLFWKGSEERNTIVFQSGIESPSLPAFVPVAGQLERSDSAYFGRVQASGSASTVNSVGGTSGGSGTGIGAR